MLATILKMKKELTDIERVRLKNLRKLFEQRDTTIAAFAIAMQEHDTSMSSILSGNLSIGPRRARKFEDAAKLPRGTLDIPDHTDYLMHLNEQESHLINYFRLADPEAKLKILDAGRVLSRFDELLKNQSDYSISFWRPTCAPLTSRPQRRHQATVLLPASIQQCTSSSKPHYKLQKAQFKSHFGNFLHVCKAKKQAITNRN